MALLLMAAVGAASYAFHRHGESDRAAPRDGSPQEAIEVLPAEGELLDAAGKPDSQSQYFSTVMVSLQAPKKGAECSGVLIGPQHVLTAAHCVCKSASSPADGGPPTVVDGTHCSEEAYAATVRFSTSDSTDEVEFRSYKGIVHPHPEFKMVLDGNGAPLSVNADLAVVVLKKAVDEVQPEPLLVEHDIQSQETLVMAGYGHGEEWGGGNERYFRSNKILGPEGSSKDRFLYGQQGSFLFNGFDGGPCFREQGSRRWLVGIASVGSDKALTLTSTFAHRAWIQSEIQHKPQ